MSKKHKKIFKQKIKEMLSRAERTPAPPSIKPEIEPPILKEESEIPKIEPKTIPQPAPSVAPASIVKSDLKKIALIFGTMILVVILAAFITSKTPWLSVIASKIYNFAQLGS
jgi:hypothetical protein